MAKDKTKPRADLAPRREIAAKMEAEKKAQHRRRLAINWAIAIVIVALIAAGIFGAWWHVKSGEREVSIAGPSGVTQIPPPNNTNNDPTSFAPGIVVTQADAAAYSPSLPIPTPTPTDTPTDSAAPTDSPTDSPTDQPTDTPTDQATDQPTASPTDTPSDTSSTASNPYIVDFYVDFQSYTSATAQTTYGPALTALAAKGEITLRYHLLTSDDSSNSNTASSRAAIAAACADTVDKFLPYTQAIMEATPITVTTGQIVFDDQKLKVDFPAAAGITGDDLKTFQTCYTNRATSGFVGTMSTASQSVAVPGNQTYANGVTGTSLPVMVAAAPGSTSVFQTVDLGTDMYSATPSTSEDALLALIGLSAYGLAGATGG